ncbi:MAG: Mrp/NBP35 family ATP-binding protein [Victivallaceae bacterium]|nr:Mrp/NBP35 family ATP-binding protein [Victivallaceae bacterium]
MSSEEPTASCSGHCSDCASQSEDCQLNLVLGAIRHKIVVMSGKGGVGKSTVAANLAAALAADGRKVGLLDVDLHGPSIPAMLGLDHVELQQTENGKIIPPEVGNLKVMSVGFVLENSDQAVIWRGPAKIGVIKQFLSEIEWGELDCLVVDCPPGTGDEPLTVCQLLPNADGAVVVTTPQRVAADDVSKSLDFCSQLGFRVLGIVENMSCFVCPKCGEITDIFSSGAGERLAEKFHVPFLGKLPIDPAVCRAGDTGRPFVEYDRESPAARAFEGVLAVLRKLF